MIKRLITIGDIHGCYQQLVELIEKELKLSKDDKLILLGDYIDRGPHSKEVLDYIMQLMEDGFNIIPLMGNHEDLLLKALTDFQQNVTWCYNGGNRTLQSFGVDEPTEIDTKYIDFIKSLKYYHIEDDFIFVHAGLNDNVTNPFDDTYHMLWSRTNKYNNPVLLDKTIIHGHTPISVENCEKIVSSNSSIINLDTGCVYKEKQGYGKLTALDIHNGVLFSV